MDQAAALYLHGLPSACPLRRGQGAPKGGRGGGGFFFGFWGHFPIPCFILSILNIRKSGGSDPFYHPPQMEGNGGLRGGMVWGSGQPWPTPPPPHIRKIVLRQKMKLKKGAGNLRPISGTQIFFASDLPPPPPGGGFSLSNSLGAGGGFCPTVQRGQRAPLAPELVVPHRSPSVRVGGS